MTSPKILISILNWNNAEDTNRCITSVLNQDYDNYEIIVVDNASTDSSVEKISRAFPNIHIIEAKDNLGFASGHQLVVDFGISKKYDLIWILNNDLLVEKTTLSYLVKVYLEKGNAIYGSTVLYLENKSTIEFMGGWTIKNNEVDFTKKPNIYKDKQFKDCVPAKEYDYYSHIMGASMLIPFDVIKKYGFMDSSFFMYAEEKDYCFRMREFNISSIIVYKSIVLHHRQKSTNKNKLPFLRHYYIVRNNAYFMKRHRGFSNVRIFKELNNWNLIHSLKIILTSFTIKKFKWQLLLKYYNFLALLHFYKQKKGRTLNPDKM